MDILWSRLWRHSLEAWMILSPPRSFPPCLRDVVCRNLFSFQRCFCFDVILKCSHSVKSSSLFINNEIDGEGHDNEKDQQKRVPVRVTDAEKDPAATTRRVHCEPNAIHLLLLTERMRLNPAA